MEDQSHTKSQEASELLSSIKSSKHFSSEFQDICQEYIDRQNRHLNAKTSKRNHLNKYYSGFQKKNLQFIQKFSQDTQNQNKSQIQSYINEQTDEKILSTIQDISALPSTVLKLDILSHYNQAQILVHEKGHSYAYSYTSDKAFKKISIDTFNKVFLAIKKSKRDNFSHDDFEALPCIELMGHFTTYINEDTSFRWVIICGRNEFFPITENESAIFQNKLSTISHHIINILKRCKDHEQLRFIIKTLESSNLPIIIKDHSENIIFVNTHAEDLLDEDGQYFHEEVFNLGKSNTLHCYFEHNTFNDTDVYHYQKVNLLGELLNTLRHELSNPLFGLSLSTEILAGDDNSDKETLEFLEAVSHQSQRCQTIIKNFSQLYVDEDQFKEVQLLELLQETVTLTKSETRGIKKNIVNELDDSSPVVLTNPTWLSQVIFNLIINAAQAIVEHTMPEEGEINIVCSQQDGCFHISVIDNGPGVPAHIEKNIFDTFFTTKSEGTGLGLAICANLLNKLSGQLIYDSRRDGQGSVFTVILMIH